MCAGPCLPGPRGTPTLYILSADTNLYTRQTDYLFWHIDTQARL